MWMTDKKPIKIFTGNLPACVCFHPCSRRISRWKVGQPRPQRWNGRAYKQWGYWRRSWESWQRSQRQLSVSALAWSFSVVSTRATLSEIWWCSSSVLSSSPCIFVTYRSWVFKKVLDLSFHTSISTLFSMYSLLHVIYMLYVYFFNK